MTGIKRSFKTEKEYREDKGINFSKLAAFWHEGLYSPDHALMTVEHKSYFEYGKAFESLLQDTLKGTTEFADQFFVTGVQGNVPDQLVGWIQNGVDLKTKIKYNKPKKDGTVERSGQHKTLHAFIDECLENPGKIPLSVEQAEMLNMHVERMCDMQFMGQKAGDILRKGEWQVGNKWTDDYDGLEKKALLDVLVDLGGLYMPIDLKTTANFNKFKWMLRDRYIFQDLHYVEGIEHLFGPSMKMIFFVASKEPPHLCTAWASDFGFEDQLREKPLNEYRELCARYAMWDGAPRGWLPFQEMGLHPNFKL